MSAIDAYELEAAGMNGTAAYRRMLWATVLNLVPKKDGDKWCVLYGENLQEGIAGFGATPDEAIRAFEMAMVDVPNADVCNPRPEKTSL
jgi:hypothetical protein